MKSNQKFQTQTRPKHATIVAIKKAKNKNKKRVYENVVIQLNDLASWWEGNTYFGQIIAAHLVAPPTNAK